MVGIRPASIILVFSITGVDDSIVDRAEYFLNSPLKPMQ